VTPRSVRVALGISYHGQNYLGWQSQPSGQTVQDKIESALRRFTNAPTSVICAGRTDAGVHGLMQVVHFDTAVQRSEFSWVRGTNAHLPRDIAVQWAMHTSDQFHCRACATSRRYAYVVLQSPIRPSVEVGRVGWAFHPLALAPMQYAANLLLGEHDFSSFRAAQCQAISPVKTMLDIQISQRGAYWRFEFEANAFLHHMIRNIMGCLVQIGQGKKPPEWMADVLIARNRRVAAPTFSPDGLYFLGPRYPAHWGIPERTASFESLP
jgi:tRNA pseudouridine38-40 synthase